MIPGLCFMSIFFEVGGLTWMHASEVSWQAGIHVNVNPVRFSVRCKSCSTITVFSLSLTGYYNIATKIWNTQCLMPSPRSRIIVFYWDYFRNKLMKGTLWSGYNWNSYCSYCFLNLTQKWAYQFIIHLVSSRESHSNK